MENIKQKIIAIVILVAVVAGLVFLVSRFGPKTDPVTGEKTGIHLFTMKNPGNREIKNQGGVGNQSGTTGVLDQNNTNLKPVNIIENIINTIAGTKDNDQIDTVDTTNNNFGKAIRDFFLRNDGLPAGTSGTNNDEGLETDEINTNGIKTNNKNVPGIDIPIDIDTVGNDDPVPSNCKPGVYESKMTRSTEIKYAISKGFKKESDLTDEEKELYAWKPTQEDIDNDNMQRVLHRYWDIWSYPKNYLKPEGTGDSLECGTWTDTSGESKYDAFKAGIINENTVNTAKREVRKDFSAISMIVSTTFSSNQSTNQVLIAEKDNERYNSLLNDCRVIRGQFEGGYTYDISGTKRIDIPQYYKQGSSLSIFPFVTTGKVWTHKEIITDLKKRIKDTKDLGGLIRTDIIKSTLQSGELDTNILTQTEIGDISYLKDKNNPDYDVTYDFPKNKAENISVFKDAEDARYSLTRYPKLQYGGENGNQEIRGSTFWSGNQLAMNFNPGMYMIAEPQSIWELLDQDKNKVLFCRLNKFMGQWAGIESNSNPASYVNSHGINCDNNLSATKAEIDAMNEEYKKLVEKVENNRPIFFIYPFKNNTPKNIADERKIFKLPSSYYAFEHGTTMFQFYAFARDNWYTNSVQNVVFEFIKDED
jgi:hypothetical protein